MDLFSALSSASSWIILAKMAEGRVGRRPCQDHAGSGGIWGGGAPPAEAAENTVQSLPRMLEKSIRNLKKSSPDPPKSDAKRPKKKKVCQSKIVLRTALGELPDNFWEPFFRILSRLGPQDGSMLEAKMDPKSRKNRCPKTVKF